MTTCVIDFDLSLQNSASTVPTVISFEKATNRNSLPASGFSSIRIENGSTESKISVTSRSSTQKKIQIRRSLSDLFELNEGEHLLSFISNQGLRNILEDAHDYLRLRFQKNEFLLNLVRDFEDLENVIVNIAILSDSEKIEQDLKNLDSFCEY